MFLARGLEVNVCMDWNLSALRGAKKRVWESSEVCLNKQKEAVTLVAGELK